MATVTKVLNPKQDPEKILDELLYLDILFKAAEWVDRLPKIEQGGFIQWDDLKSQYIWFPTPNRFEETGLAPSLFDPPEEYYEKIFGLSEQRVFLTATFHSHPHGSTVPSPQDIDVLFLNAPLHFIYAIENRRARKISAYDSTARLVKTFYLGE